MISEIHNKLINEKSPYLFQHAYNPVNWYPWGEEAFEKAKTEDKPVFLSVGYSCCHWCRSDYLLKSTVKSDILINANYLYTLNQ